MKKSFAMNYEELIDRAYTRASRTANVYRGLENSPDDVGRKRKVVSSIIDAITHVKNNNKIELSTIGKDTELDDCLNLLKNPINENIQEAILRSITVFKDLGLNPR
jgi:hypothetical protein